MLTTLPSLLITDDDLEFRQTLRTVFEGQGFQTLLAGDGEEAIHIVRTQEVHLVLLDMHMPKLTGLEVLKAIRADAARFPGRASTISARRSASSRPAMASIRYCTSDRMRSRIGSVAR